MNAGGGSTVLFVYGSLRRGEEAHELVEAARFYGQVVTAPCYELVDLGAWPALVRGGESAIRGELYEVDEATLAALDEYEDHPTLFRREPIELTDGRVVQAYFYPPALAEGCPRMAHRDWCARPGGPLARSEESTP